MSKNEISILSSDCPGAQRRVILEAQWSSGSIDALSECKCFDDIIIPLPSSIFKKLTPALLRQIKVILLPKLKMQALTAIVSQKSKLAKLLVESDRKLDLLETRMREVFQEAIENARNSYNTALKIAKDITITTKDGLVKRAADIMGEKYLLEGQAAWAIRKRNEAVNFAKEFYGLVQTGNTVTIPPDSLFEEELKILLRGKPGDSAKAAQVFQELNDYFFRKKFDDIPDGGGPGPLVLGIEAQWDEAVELTRRRNEYRGYAAEIENKIANEFFLHDGETISLKDYIDLKKRELDEVFESRKPLEEQVAFHRDRTLRLRSEAQRMDRLKDDLLRKAAGDAEEALDFIDDLADGIDAIPGLATFIFDQVISWLSYLTIGEEHYCGGEVILDEMTCKCDSCPEGKEICRAGETAANSFFGGIGVQLPGARMGDELNVCDEPCDCGRKKIARIWSGGSTAELLDWLGLADQCYCGCEDEPPAVSGGTPSYFDLKPCNSSECPDKQICAPKYPPDDPNGLVAENISGWESEFEWDPSSCDWKCKSITDPQGNIQQGSPNPNGTGCLYEIICFSGCRNPNLPDDPDLKEERLTLSGREIISKPSCEDWSTEEKQLYSKADSVPECEVDCWVCLEGDVSNESGPELSFSGPTNIPQTKSECDNRPEGAGVQNREELDCCKFEGSWVKTCPEGYSCENEECSCVEVAFGGQSYQGTYNAEVNDCIYNVICYECGEDGNCDDKFATLTLEQIKSKPNCSDWPSPTGKARFNTCEEAENEDNCIVEDCWVCLEGDVSNESSGPTNIPQTKSECDNRPEGAGFQNREEVDCCKFEGSWVKTCPEGYSCESEECSCGEITFGGQSYQGSYNAEVNDCIYNVLCYECGEDGNCDRKSATLTLEQIKSKPNCSDWPSSSGKARFNTCEEAENEDNCIVVDCWVCIEGDIVFVGPTNIPQTKSECDNRPEGAGVQNREELDCCKSDGNWVKTCPEGYSCKDEECFTDLYYCQNG